MAIYNNEIVEIPGSGCYRKKTGGATYIYQYTSYYRNEEGAARNKSVAIGKLNDAGDMLIPNDNYYKLNNAAPGLSLGSVLCYGYTFLANHICKESGLWEALDGAFGKRSAEIFAMAAYMVHEGTVMNYCDDWLQNHYVQGLGSLITSQASSEIFASITHDERTAFFKKWAGRAFGDESVFYDVTSVSSYCSNVDFVEWGYNRDKESLAQVNIGMFCGENTRLPIYYEVYNGSLTDKSNMNFVLENAKDIGLKNVKLVLDGGFCDKTRLGELSSSGHTFTVGVPISLNEAKGYAAKYGDGINKASLRLRNHPEYCVDIPGTFMGVEGRLLLCFNEALHSDMTASILEKVDKLEEKLAKTKKFPVRNLKQFKRYFELEKTDNGFNYARKSDIIDEEAQTAGYFLLFSTDMDAKVEDLLYYYRAKDVDEKMFAQIKVNIEGRRLRIHNNDTMHGKIFVIFIALVIRSYMLNHLGDYLAKEHITFKKAMLRLSDIKIIKNRDGYRFLKALTKKQKLLLSVFSVQDEISENLSEIKTN